LNGDDIAEIFPDVLEGTAGRLIYQRLMVAQIGGRIFLEVHRDAYGKQPDAWAMLDSVVKAHNLTPLLDWRIVRGIMTRQDGLVHDVTKAGGP
jgi:hypothetical protein